MIRYLSVCSGIEAATVAWHGLGLTPVGFAENEKFPSAVLAHHYPSVPNYGDFTKLIEAPPQCDLLVGGTPCQAFSVAGDRASLSDRRGNLTLQFVRLAHAIKSLSWGVWENVPGVLSTNDNAFGHFLGALVGADAPLCSPHHQGRWPGAGMVAGPKARVAWRILDAQYFGVPQRRRRVFVVASFGSGDPAQVLFEPNGGCWNIEAGREAGEDIAKCLPARASQRYDESSSSVRLTPIPFALRGRLGGAQVEARSDGNIGSLRASSGGSSRDYLAFETSVRRLTPIECERLQGFPDGYTAIPWRGRPAEQCPDGPRYKALGNSMAVPVMRWLGARIALGGPA